jgi:hypothetical protein
MNIRSSRRSLSPTPSLYDKMFGVSRISYRKSNNLSNNNNEKSLSENIKEKNPEGIITNITTIIRNIFVLLFTLLFLYFTITIIYYYVIKKIFKYNEK